MINDKMKIIAEQQSQRVVLKGNTIKDGNTIYSVKSPFTFKKEIEYNNLSNAQNFSNSQADTRVNDTFSFTIYDFTNGYSLGGENIRSNGFKSYIFTCNITSNNINFYHSGSAINIYILEYANLVGGHKYWCSFDCISHDSRVVGGLHLKNFIVIDLTQLYGSGNEPTTKEQFFATELGKEIEKGVILPYSLSNRVLGLPSEYQEVEYIESNGNQFIDTGVYIDRNKLINGIKVEQVALFINDNTRAQAEFKNGAPYLFIGMYADSTFYSGIGNSYGKSKTIYNDTNYHKFEVDSKYMTTKVDGETIFTSNVIDGNIFSNIHLFNTSNGSYGMKQRKKMCKIYDNNALVRDFIPCYRVSDNVIGLYDLVNGQFYTNNGTGTFTKGNDVGLKPLTYIRTKRVDLGTLTWFYNSSTGHERFQSGGISTLIKKPSAGNIKANIICSKYKTVTDDDIYLHREDKTIGVYTNGNIEIYDSTYTDATEFKNSLTGVILEYETAEPLELNGIGTNYDTYENHSGKVVRKIRKVKLKDLTYTKSSTIFIIANPTDFNDNANTKLVCSKYDIEYSASLLSLKNKTISTNVALTGKVGLILKDTDYNDVTALRNSFADTDYLYYELKEEEIETERSVLVDYRYNKVVDSNGNEIDTD